MKTLNFEKCPSLEMREVMVGGLLIVLSAVYKSEIRQSARKGFLLQNSNGISCKIPIEYLGITY